MKPTLVVMAAGMGSRFGGLKQMTPVDPQGDSILHFSLYDAQRAGFGKVVFVIKKVIRQDFEEKVSRGLEKYFEIAYVEQELDRLPEGFSVPAGRERPWGTAHAILCAKEEIHGPFAVVNADDFYGRDAFEVIARELARPHSRPGDYCMVGFRVGNTMTENGSVARGVCVTRDGLLTSVVERTAIAYNASGDISFTDENGTEQILEPNTPVSMNMWGFTPDYFDLSDREFRKFLDANINAPKAEFYVPLCIDPLIRSGEATVKVLDTTSRWFGVTYAADRPGVVAKFASLHADGTYPEHLFI